MNSLVLEKNIWIIDAIALLILSRIILFKTEKKQTELDHRFLRHGYQGHAGRTCRPGPKRRPDDVDGKLDVQGRSFACHDHWLDGIADDDCTSLRQTFIYLLTAFTEKSATKNMTMSKAYRKQVALTLVNPPCKSPHLNCSSTTATAPGQKNHYSFSTWSGGIFHNGYSVSSWWW
jgi:hypothetical protein